MTRECLGINPDDWPIPQEVGKGCVPIFQAPIEVRAVKTVNMFGGMEMPTTQIEPILVRSSRGFEARISNGSTVHDFCEDHCQVMVGIHANQALIGLRVPVGVQTQEGFVLKLVKLENSIPSISRARARGDYLRLDFEAYGVIERLVRLEAGESAKIFLPATTIA